MSCLSFPACDFIRFRIFVFFGHKKKDLQMSAIEFELITIGQSDDITTKESYIDASSIPVASSVVLPHLVDEACP